LEKGVQGNLRIDQRKRKGNVKPKKKPRVEIDTKTRLLRFGGTKRWVKEKTNSPWGVHFEKPQSVHKVGKIVDIEPQSQAFNPTSSLRELWVKKDEGDGGG